MKIREASRGLVVAAVLAVVAGIGVGSWLLLRDSETWTRDRCGDAASEFSVEEEGDGVEVSFELQSLAPGEVWAIALDLDGTTILEGERTTDEDAELEVDVLVPDDGGEFTATATPPDGQPCSLTLRHG